MTQETDAADSPSRSLLIALSGFALPGLGHILLGKTRRGVAFLVLLSLLFFVGVALERDYYSKFGSNILGLAPQDPETAAAPPLPPDDEGALDQVWKWTFTWLYPFFVGFLNYVLGYFWAERAAPLVVALSFVENIHRVPVTVRDIGYCFALLAGLLNLLTMMDAYDIGCNQQELERRDRK